MKKRDGGYRAGLAGVLAVAMLLLSGSRVCAGWVDLSPPDVSPDWSLYGVHFTSADEGWAVGTDYYNRKGVLLQFASNTWTSVDPPVVSPDWELFSVHFTSPTLGWAVGRDHVNSRGVLLRYLDGLWVSVTPPTVSTYWYLNSVYFTSATEGWAVGVDGDEFSVANSGVILHYVNGSWSVATVAGYVSSIWTLNGVHFATAGDGWAVGDNLESYQGGGVLLHYQNGAWSRVQPPNAGTNWDLTSVYFTSANTGWAVGNDYQFPDETGLLFRYTNGTWTPVRRSHSSLDWNLFSTHFVSSAEGWAVGLDVPALATQTGLLMHYSGGSWSFVSPPHVSSDWGLTGVHFTSSDEGWAVGRDHWNGRGVLLRYSVFPEIQVTPASIDFGNVSAGETFQKKITIKNMGGVPLTLDTIGSVAPPFVRGGTCTDEKILTPNGTCTLLIDFTPLAGGLFTSSFDISSDDLDDPVVTVELEGRSGPGDLVGTWSSMIQTCNTTSSGTKCKLEGTLLVENEGYKDLSSSHIYFYLSDDGSYNPGIDTYLKKKSTGKIKYEGSKSFAFTYKFPVGVAVTGKHIIAVLDATNKVVELDDDLNNTVVSDAIPAPP